jgi:hypothetical protein
MWSAVLSLIFLLLYILVPMGDTALLFAGVPLFAVFLMKFPPMGPFMTELFPTQIRGNAQGFCYNSGRAIGSFFPTVIGYASESLGLGISIAVFSPIASALMIVMLLMLPETRGRSLAALDGDAVTAVPGE